MKIRLRVAGKTIVADGAGVALTVFLGEDGVGRLSLASCNVSESGDYAHNYWINDQPLVVGETLLVDLVEQVETTPPSFERKESCKDHLEAQKQYGLKLIAGESNGVE